MWFSSLSYFFFKILNTFSHPQLHHRINLLRILPGADDAAAPPAGEEDCMWSRQIGSLQEHLRCSVLLPHPHCAAGCGWRAALWVSVRLYSSVHIHLSTVFQSWVVSWFQKQQYSVFSARITNVTVQVELCSCELQSVCFRLRVSLHHTGPVSGHAGCLHVCLWDTGTVCLCVHNLKTFQFFWHLLCMQVILL